MTTFSASDENGAFAVGSPNTIVTTANDGTFTYTFPQAFSTPPNVQATPIVSGPGLINALDVDLQMPTTTQVSGVVFGYRMQSVVLQVTPLSLGSMPIKTDINTSAKVLLMIVGKLA